MRQVWTSRNLSDGKVIVSVSMDKEEFDHILWSYKAAWDRDRRTRLWGEDIIYMQLVRDILKAAEEGCTNV